MIYKLAIASSLTAAMEADPKVVCMGVGVSDPKAIFGTIQGANENFPERVIETPLSENMLTGACVGLALEGWKPILVHARTDFLMITMEQLVNTAAKWRFMAVGRPVTFVIRSIIGRGWGQGPQHSQALHALFAQVPGLNVLMPATAACAEEALPWALSQPTPTLIIEHRRLYETEITPAEANTNPDSSDVTIVYISAAVLDVLEASRILVDEGIQPTLVCLEQIAPLSTEAILASVRHTGRLVVVDVGHSVCGISSELVAVAAQQFPGVHVRRVTPPFVPCPTSFGLEPAWYPDTSAVVDAVHSVMQIEVGTTHSSTRAEDQSFKGPF